MSPARDEGSSRPIRAHNSSGTIHGGCWPFLTGLLNRHTITDIPDQSFLLGVLSRRALAICCDVTWALTVPSPLRFCDTRWKESEVLQMSPPPPTPLQVPSADRLSWPTGRGPRCR